MESDRYRAVHRMTKYGRAWRRLSELVALALVVGSLSLCDPALASTAQVVSTAVTESPSSWATSCSSQKLGLDKDDLELAQPLKKNPDANPDGSPVKIQPDQRGKYVPVIMVHGWISKDTQLAGGDRDGTFSHLIDLTTNQVVGVSTTRSLIGQLQRIPGTAVFTFDYRDYAARWVDDPHLGPALGKVIDCLYQASGEKVIVVGHSMGGLVTRWAVANPGVAGPDRSSEISTVVTFGTPETGSVAALLGDAGANLGAAVNDYAAIVRLFLATCGQLSSNEVQTGTVCDTLPGPLRTFDSDAGIALRAGSSQLAALKPFPKSIRLDALAGNATFEVPKIGWFGITTSSTKIPVGDLIVTGASAFQGADSTTRASCDYEINPVRGVSDTIGLTFGLTSKADVAQLPLAAFGGACFHTNLMRDIELTNEATGAVNDDIAGRQLKPVTDKLLLSAPVPALRGNPAGNMVNGVLPNTGNGTVSLVLTGGGSPAHGDLNGDGIQDAAAVIGATSGAGGEDEYVELYTNGNRRLAEWDPATATQADHAHVAATLIRNGDVLVDGSSEHLPNGPETYWSARLHWDGQQLNAQLQLGHTGATNSGLWSDAHLAITPTSLGAVKIGMSLQAAKDAAGVFIDVSGDGYYDSTQLPPGSLHLYVRGSTVTCVGVGTSGTATQRVVTAEGVAVGDPVSKVLATYSSRVKFVPAPAGGGMTSNSGYVVSSPGGDLVFIIDDHNQTVGQIAGGPHETPNSCTG